MAPGRQHGWVALLRAINVGGRNKVPMGLLRELLEEHGCSAVRTYIQSGNVLFLSPTANRGALRRRLESSIEEAFGVSTVVVLRTFAELIELAGAPPFGAQGEDTFVYFLRDTPAAAGIEKLAALEAGDDRFEVAGGNVYLHYPNGVQGARLAGARLERALGVPGTARNWRTVSKLAELAAAVD